MYNFNKNIISKIDYRISGPCGDKNRLKWLSSRITVDKVGVFKGSD
jgi:hypothetical protein